MKADREVLSEKVIQLLATAIYSIGQLETLLLLFRTPERQWSANEIARELRSNAAQALEHLQSLEHHSLMDHSGDQHYKYNPKTPELDAAVRELAIAYASHRTRIIDLVYGSRTEKIVNLANAFRWRKRKDDE